MRGGEHQRCFHIHKTRRSKRLQVLVDDEDSNIPAEGAVDGQPMRKGRHGAFEASLLEPELGHCLVVVPVAAVGCSELLSRADWFACHVWQTSGLALSSVQACYWLSGSSQLRRGFAQESSLLCQHLIRK